MSDKVTDVTLQSGFLKVTKDSGAPYQIPATDFLRAADIPDLNIDSLTLLTNGMQVLAALIETLLVQEVIGEDWASGYDLDYAIEVLEALNAEFGESDDEPEGGDEDA